MLIYKLKTHTLPHVLDILRGKLVFILLNKCNLTTKHLNNTFIKFTFTL